MEAGRPWSSAQEHGASSGGAVAAPHVGVIERPPAVGDAAQPTGGLARVDRQVLGERLWVRVRLAADGATEQGRRCSQRCRRDTTAQQSAGRQRRSPHGPAGRRRPSHRQGPPLSAREMVVSPTTVHIRSHTAQIISACGNKTVPRDGVCGGAGRQTLPSDVFFSLTTILTVSGKE